MNSVTTQKTNSSLLGRSVYFKLSKKKLTSSQILDLTPGKMYEIIGVATYSVCIKDETGDNIRVYLVGYSGTDKSWTTAHLGNLTSFILAAPRTVSKYYTALAAAKESNHE